MLSTASWGTRKATVRRWFEFGFALVCTILIGVLVFGGAINGPHAKLPFGEYLAVLLIGSAGLWFIGAVLTSKTVLFERGLLVQNWFNRYWIPWPEVTAVEVDPAVALVLRDGSEIGVGVGGSSLWNALWGNRYQRGLRERIEQVRTVAPPDSSAGVAHARRLGVVRFLGWAGLFFGVALAFGHLF
ncbi:hypothetical protein [Amycolatopsis cihanbeyliensis]|uniref:PH (Pleckstrin Homology) domain-containing protein n=1 Tax=Amycolatopsis cihanbeyliensis TaxID=1128664 RepID=A0A542DCW0_AMYCI|nr:hypothetical protein [Amycolatopsis cihanbeyliensis]TQJ00904.1 hypothetical protein FB471_0555 [Amycolatopsis cihanbeyliensis]